MQYSWNFGVIWQYKWLLWDGVLVTLGYTIASVVIGLVIGVAVGIGLLSRSLFVRFCLGAYVELFRCTPLLVQLIWFYYALPVLIGAEIQAWLAGLLALSLYAGAFYAEVFRGGIQSIERGQWDAAKALNMTRAQSLRRIILPQATKRMIPPFINQSIVQLKNTSLISTLALADLLYQGQIITSATYRPLEVFSLIAVLYFILLFPITVAARHVENYLARSD